MTLEETQNLASAWMLIESGVEEAFDRMYDLLHDDPENAWLVIQEINSRELSDDLMANLAAGPLEDLLALHGDLFIERIEVKAENDPKFNRLLGGVWQNEMSDDVWERVKRIRKEVW
ncbi:MAG TPA: hypothetical protein VGI63_04340 [Verrucomicrobiae bacterium]|jgi:hypothetical protein